MSVGADRHGSAQRSKPSPAGHSAPSPVAYSATGISVPILDGVSELGVDTSTRRLLSSRKSSWGTVQTGRAAPVRRGRFGERRYAIRRMQVRAAFREGVFDERRHRDATCVSALNSELGGCQPRGDEVVIRLESGANREVRGVRSGVDGRAVAPAMRRRDDTHLNKCRQQRLAGEISGSPIRTETLSRLVAGPSRSRLAHSPGPSSQACAPPGRPRTPSWR
jgi:hypothetical protein